MKKDDLIRHQLDGLTSEVYEWECLTPTVFFKDKIKLEKSEKEIVLAYLRVAEFVYYGMFNDNNPIPHMKVIRNNQVCMPFLYLCR